MGGTTGWDASTTGRVRHRGPGIRKRGSDSPNGRANFIDSRPPLRSTVMATSSPVCYLFMVYASKSDSHISFAIYCGPIFRQ